MITNFEEITKKLTEGEKMIVPIIVKALQKHVGKSAIISNREMREGLKNKKDIKIGDARVRKILNYIRNNNLIEGLVASSNGYYVTHNPAEIERYIKSLDEREAMIRAIKNNFQLYLMKLLKK